MKRLETKRLILRDFKVEDAADFYYYAKDPETGPMAGWPPHQSIEETLEKINLFIEKNEVWAIENKEDHKMIGSIGLHDSQNYPGYKVIGYVLNQDYRCRGLMTEACKEIIRYAFEELNLDVIYIGHFPENIASSHVILKCGFKYEGTLRKSLKLYDGRIVDKVSYSLLKEEYFASKQLD